jgi:hypothetical protein
LRLDSHNPSCLTIASTLIAAADKYEALSPQGGSSADFALAGEIDGLARALALSAEPPAAKLAGLRAFLFKADGVPFDAVDVLNAPDMFASLANAA